MVVLFSQYRKDKKGEEEGGETEKGIMERGRGREEKGKEAEITNSYPDLSIVLPAGRSCGLTYLWQQQQGHQCSSAWRENSYIL